MEQDNNLPIPNQQPVEETAQLSKQEMIAEKKAKFDKSVKKILFIIGGTILGILIIITLGMIYMKTKNNFVVTQKDPPQENNPIVKQEENEENKKEYYKNDTFRFSFEYEPTNKLDIQEKENANFLAQVISEDAVPQEEVSGDKLVKGYFFSVQPISLTIRNLDEAINVKREAIVETCPDTAQVSNISTRNIDGLEAKFFEVTYCNSDYIINYVSANGYVYEIAQVYKGDLGIRQMYKSATEDMLNSLKIYRDAVVEEIEEFVTYSDSAGRFSFKYPSELDTKCCFVAPPPQLANINTLMIVSEGENKNTLGVYTAHFRGRGYIPMGFEEFVEKQKQVLIDDYLIIKGFKPDGKEYEIDVKGKRGYVLEDFSWQENDLIIIDLQNTNLPFLIISKTDISEDIYNGIIDSFEFF